MEVGSSLKCHDIMVYVRLVTGQEYIWGAHNCQLMELYKISVHLLASKGCNDVIIHGVTTAKLNIIITGDSD